jgi:hypothetical protein
MSNYYDMCIRNPRKTAALIKELIDAAEEVVEDTNYLVIKPNNTDSFGINGMKLWKLKQAIPRT